MDKIEYYLNIGTNIGDRKQNISLAVAMIRRRFACKVRESTAVESAPWGFVSENRFLNVGVAFATDESPHDVLGTLHKIELDMGCGSHRKPDGSYADRLIDIDIVAIDEMMIDTPELVVPHPHMAERDFVLAPMAELAPQWRHPVLHKSAAELLQCLRGSDM